MIKNQFAYSVKVIEGKDDQGVDIIGHVKQTFNIEYVIRSIALKGGGLMVILDDGHERSEDVPVKDKKGKIEMRRERNRFQSEIELLPEDAERFLEMVTL